MFAVSDRENKLRICISALFKRSSIRVNRYTLKKEVQRRVSTTTSTVCSRHRTSRNRDQGVSRDEGQKGHIGAVPQVAHLHMLCYFLCRICLLLKSNIISNMQIWCFYLWISKQVLDDHLSVKIKHYKFKCVKIQ